jgi:hypothetical protein
MRWSEEEAYHSSMCSFDISLRGNEKLSASEEEYYLTIYAHSEGKLAKMYVSASSCLFFCPHATSRGRLDGF